MLMDPEVTRLVGEFCKGWAETIGQLERRQLEAMQGYLEDFLDDLLNYPLVRPWRESLDLFQEHYWEQAGMRLTPDSYKIIAQIIEAEINDPTCYAHGPIQPDATGLPPGRRPEDALAEAKSAVAASKPRDPTAAIVVTLPEKISAATAEQCKQLRESARKAALLEQQRIQCSDAEVPRYEYFLYDNLLRRARGQTLRTSEEYWLGRNDVLDNALRKSPPGQIAVNVAARGPRPTQTNAREQFFNEKVAEAQGHLDEMRRLLEALGQRLDAAKIDEEVDVDADADQIEDLIWRYNDAMESARDAWLRDNLSSDANTRLLEMLTPASLGLPLFTDDQQAKRAMRQGIQISERLGNRNQIMNRVVLGMQVVETAGAMAGYLALGTVAIKVGMSGGKWAVIKAIAVVGGVVFADKAVEKGLSAAGASEQTITGIRLAAVVVTFILLHRANRSASAETPSPARVEPAATPPVRPKSRILAPEDARRKVGIAFNKARESAYPQNEVPIEKPTGGRPYALDSYDPFKGEIVFRRHTQFSEIQFKTAQAYFREFVKKYPPGSVIADVRTTPDGMAGQKLEGKMIFEVPPQWKAIPQAVLREAARYEIMIRDSNGRIYHAD